jgi:hypothetical protein
MLHLTNWRNEKMESRETIRKTLSNYMESKTREMGIELVKVMRNGINIISGISTEDLYNDTVAFSKLVKLAQTV